MSESVALLCQANNVGRGSNYPTNPSPNPSQFPLIRQIEASTRISFIHRATTIPTPFLCPNDPNVSSTISTTKHWPSWDYSPKGPQSPIFSKMEVLRETNWTRSNCTRTTEPSINCCVPAHNSDKKRTICARRPERSALQLSWRTQVVARGAWRAAR